MDIKTIKTGYLKENCYLLINNNDCLIIDPGDDLDIIKEKIKNYNLLGILITHYHFDHIGALNGLNCNNIYDYKLKEGLYKINNFEFDIIYTKGHTNDSVSFYFKKQNIMFTGDFLFKESIGRTDLGGNESDMKESINLIKKYDKNIIIYPGHGDSTTLNYELNNNFYLK
jgi:glyoxylase-like metal-dependent hydrolase (beta-lactamase superfamily II)